MYVGKSKVNTDKNNASSIVSVCGTANADENVYSKLSANAGKTVIFSWSAASKKLTGEGSITPTGDADDALKTAIKTYMATVLPDGLPEAKQGSSKPFTLTFTVDSTGNSLSVTCTQ